jgi:hypothetical protein
MDLRSYKGTVYGKLKNRLFQWDSNWESFRPIEKIVWNGKELKSLFPFFDMFDPYYGFGSSDMKQLCDRLTEITNLETAVEQLPWIEGEWFKDRNVPFESCVAKTQDSWKKYIQYTGSCPKTLRKQSFHATRRLIRK